MVRFSYHSYYYRPNWTPLSPITITKHSLLDRRFMSQAGRTRYFARSATRGAGKNKALFFSSSRLALRAKYRVRPAWLIKRLLCRLYEIFHISVSLHSTTIICVLIHDIHTVVYYLLCKQIWLSMQRERSYALWISRCLEKFRVSMFVNIYLVFFSAFYQLRMISELYIFVLSFFNCNFVALICFLCFLFELYFFER